MSALIDPQHKLVDIDLAHHRFRVNRDAYRSAEIFEKEKQLIFSKCWLYVGHASELPSKGDFVARTVGGGDLIFMRGRSAKSFACPYHGWVFNSDGKLVSMNATRGFDADINADGALNLRKVPRLEEYRGFYFANYNSAAISLVDYLAGAKEYLDSMCDQSEAGLVVLPGEHSYSINANFKYLCENSYDGYHLLPVHVSYLEFLDDRLKAGGGDGAVNFIANLFNK